MVSIMAKKERAVRPRTFKTRTLKRVFSQAVAVS